MCALRACLTTAVFTAYSTSGCVLHRHIGMHQLFAVVQAQRSAFTISCDVVPAPAIFDGWFEDAVPQSLYRKPGTFSPNVLAQLAVHHMDQEKWESGVSLLMLSLSYGYGHRENSDAWVSTIGYLEVGSGRLPQDANHLRSMHEAAVLMALCLR